MLTAYLSGDAQTMAVRRAVTSPIQLTIETDTAITLSVHVSLEGDVTVGASIDGVLSAAMVGTIDPASGHDERDRFTWLADLPINTSNIRPGAAHLSVVPDPKENHEQPDMD